jgi:hypothetical protein
MIKRSYFHKIGASCADEMDEHINSGILEYWNDGKME